ncbi:hypothetical protein BGX23_002662 [Mortierella sp. AD031]|nr:hypothetical protein BGX23_002662 [Mortierella sp. AD031]KAG0213990.1 hypothetical protein BGX33_002550 [Mortierella sp. NVP41]
MHGVPFLTTLVEMFCFSETLRIQRRRDLAIFFLFGLSYSCWSSLCAYIDAEWPYPILQNQTSDLDRYIMMFKATAAGLVVHFIISEIHIRTISKATPQNK